MRNRLWVCIAVVLTSQVNSLTAQVSTEERNALISLYNSTGGANWTDRSNWRNAGNTDFGDPGTECTWYGVRCSGGLILGVELVENNLTGEIPSDIGSFPNLLRLNLDRNHLSGPIPPGIGDLSNMHTLTLRANMLSGELPTELLNLTNLGPDVSDFRNNALFSDDASLITFLNETQMGGEWQLFQTVPPENLRVEVPSYVSGTPVGDTTIWLSWDEMPHADYVEVYASLAGHNVWTIVGRSFLFNYCPITGLESATDYDLRVRAFKEPYWANANLVPSVFGPVVPASTGDGGCLEPKIEISWGDPTTLSLSDVYDSYYWITGETSPTVEYFEIPNPGFWWVSVTTNGLCEEAASKSIVYPDIFDDGFESGDTDAWSDTMP